MFGVYFLLGALLIVPLVWAASVPETRIIQRGRLPILWVHVTGVCDATRRTRPPRSPRDTGDGRA
eukprot:2496535-Prymnesium_polylepis.1